MKGTFLSFEGIEGSGKSTQAKLLYQHLKKRGIDVMLTAEPGGTRIGKRIRTVLLSVEHVEMSPLTELLLYNASRAQHIHEVIIPALGRGTTVITDRFTDSTIAYQGYGRGLDLGMIDEIDRIATGRFRPDITLLLDLEVTTGLLRNRGLNKSDRLEREDISFHEKVRKGYHRIAAQEPLRVKLVRAINGAEEVHRNIIRIMSQAAGL
jgi:dTMP kinase